MPVVSSKAGYVAKLEAKAVGEISVELGAGRIKKEDDIDHSVGIILEKKISDYVEKGEIVAYIHANDEEKGKKAVIDLQNTYIIEEEEIKAEDYILDVI